MWLLVIATAVGLANCQFVKTANYGVKGGYSHGGQRHQYSAGESPINYNTNSTQQGNLYGGQQHASPSIPQPGVCYIEVPTATLVRDPTRVPEGNGSRPDLSRIRSCCNGYIRNIHNYDICDPICTAECINALCTAPDTCTCFPEHVKNVAGFCVPTCPIGCQNGYCAGGECICNDGFKLDLDSKYCVPNCKDNCGGIGNCTAPNVCSCKSGYRPTPQGSCQAVCDRPCNNGDCVAPNDCRCHSGYTIDPRGTGCISNVVTTTLPPVHTSQPIPNTGQHGSPNSYNNHRYPSYYPSNYSSNHPQSPDNQRPYHTYNPSPSNYPNNYNQNPYYPENNPLYYSTEIPHQLNNISSDSQVRPQNPINSNNQSNYGPLHPGPDGQLSSGYPYNQTGYPSSDPSNPSNPNLNQRPTNGAYYPYYPNPSNPTGPPSNPQQPGYYPSQPYQPGYQNRPYQTSPTPGQPHQPGYPYNPSHPEQPAYSQDPSGQPRLNNTNQPNEPFNPYQPGYQPGQTFNPHQPGQPINPHQPGYQPGQPLNPHQPGYQPSQPFNPYQPGQPFNQPQYPTNQPNSPYPYDQNGYEAMIPQCPQPCINSVCVEGGKCNCNPGYVMDSTDVTKSRCIPHCPGGCQNGVCSAPNFCICNLGYRKEQGIKGRSGCVKRLR